jgi:hypothetical protein
MPAGCRLSDLILGIDDEEAERITSDMRLDIIPRICAVPTADLRANVF